MKNVLGYIGIGLFLIFLVPLIIILVPFTIIANLIDMPFKKRRLEKFQETITNAWLPRQKYLYLHYRADTEVGQLLETEILPKYKKYLAIDSWSMKGDRKTEGVESDMGNAVSIVMNDIVGDFDCEIEMTLAAILPETNFFENEKELLCISGDVRTSKLDDPQQAKEEIEQKIQGCLAAWGIKK